MNDRGQWRKIVSDHGRMTPMAMGASATTGNSNVTNADARPPQNRPHPTFENSYKEVK